MKCIFLDFDGVINNWEHFEGVAPENANILKRIIELSGAKVVVTSSNKYCLQRKPHTYYYASKFYNVYAKSLTDLGIEIFALTPDENSNRSLEIKKYLEANNVEEYVILDDELVDRTLQPHQVFIDLYQGLQEEHLAPSLKILNGQLGFYPPNYNREEQPIELVKRINAHYSKNNYRQQ